MALDLNQLRKTSVYEVSAPLATMAGDLSRIESLASQWNAKRRRYLIWGIGLILMSAGGFIAFPLVFAGTFIAGVVLLFLRKRYPKGIAEGLFFCQFSREFTSALARDADPAKPSSLRLEFSPKQELLSATDLPRRRRGKQKIFRAPWFTLETRLLDGTSVSQTIDDIIRKRSFINPRGKYKTKTRTRHIVSMKFGYADDVYGDMRPFAAKMQKEIQLPGSARVRGLEVTDRAVKIKAVMNERGDLMKACGLLALGAYRMLNLSRRMRERQHRRAQRKGGPR